MRFLRRHQGQPIGPDGKVRPLQVREGGVGVLEGAEKTRSLIDINAIADLMQHYQRAMRRGLAQNDNGPRALGGYADTIRK